MALFGANTDAPCGIFAPLGGVTQTTFVRKTAWQTSAGDTLLSFAEVATYGVTWQPSPSGTFRHIGGVVVEVVYVGFVNERTILKSLDRCYIDEEQLEVVQVAHWEDGHDEIGLRHIAR